MWPARIGPLNGLMSSHSHSELGHVTMSVEDAANFSIAFDAGLGNDFSQKFFHVEMHPTLCF